MSPDQELVILEMGAVEAFHSYRQWLVANSDLAGQVLLAKLCMLRLQDVDTFKATAPKSILAQSPAALLTTPRGAYRRAVAE